jgi:peptidyl-tRNA hydrolase, PTH1 family
MRLFVGLGNPGREHAGQRHNIGFMAVDAIARRHRAPPFRARFQGTIAEITLAGERTLLLKPATYMNESGRSVREAARFFKLELPDLTVFHDELDLAPGLVRVKVGGGNAGHNGLRSITAELGNDYRRVRLGIGHPGTKERVLGHVLGDFGRDEMPWVDTLCEAVAAEAEDLVRGHDNQFQNKVFKAMSAVLPQGGS